MIDFKWIIANILMVVGMFICLFYSISDNFVSVIIGLFLVLLAVVGYAILYHTGG